MALVKLLFKHPAAGESGMRHVFSTHRCTATLALLHMCASMARCPSSVGTLRSMNDLRLDFGAIMLVQLPSLQDLVFSSQPCMV
eukprot:scaffold163006_cov19-Tisochrysis_lutea.AAC.2